MGPAPRRRKPAKLHADKTYDHADLPMWVRKQNTAVRITRKGIESSEKLSKNRWVIKRTIAWPLGYHQLAIRHHRRANHSCVFPTLAAMLTCYKKLAKNAR